MNAPPVPRRRLRKRLWIAAAAACAGLAASVFAAQRPAAPPPMVPPAEQADFVLVEKAARRLTLMRGGVPIRRYDVALGGDPVGHKLQEGDQKTPEGRYVLDWRNPRSMAYLSLHVSYPNDADKARAAAAGVDPGGMIMIHGVRNGLGWLGPLHRLWDWTDGCIAVTDAEMAEIWSLVPNGAPIEIRP